MSRFALVEIFGQLEMLIVHVPAYDAITHDEEGSDVYYPSVRPRSAATRSR